MAGAKLVVPRTYDRYVPEAYFECWYVTYYGSDPRPRLCIKFSIPGRVVGAVMWVSLGNVDLDRSSVTKRINPHFKVRKPSKALRVLHILGHSRVELSRANKGFLKAVRRHSFSFYVSETREGVSDDYKADVESLERGERGVDYCHKRAESRVPF
jgi:hypothetical protein